MTRSLDTRRRNRYPKETMSSRFRNLGLLFAATALMLVALVLPFHAHDRAQAKDKVDCAACHLLKDTHTLTTIDPVVIPTSFETTVALTVMTRSIVELHFWIAASPRAPPFVS